MRETDVVPHQRSGAALSSGLEAFLLADGEDQRRKAEPLLALAGVREFVAERIRDLPVEKSVARSTLFRLASIDAVRRLPAGDDSWADTVISWLDAGGATWQESANVCADVGFQAYLVDRLAPVTVALVLERDPLTVAGRAMLHLHLASMRLAYQWEAMEECLQSVGVPMADLDPYSRTFHVFAMLVEGHPDAASEFDRLIAIAGDDYRVGITLLEGLRLSRDFPDQGQRMLDLLERPALRSSSSPDPLYRRAFALRRLGRFDEALRAVDECLQRISPLQVRDRIRIIQERELILAEQAIQEQAAATAAATETHLRAATMQLEALAAQQLEDVRSAVADSLFRVVEILGVFTAVIALLGASVASAAIGSLAWWQRCLLIITAGIVISGFFFTLRAIVHSPLRRRTVSGADRNVK